MTYHQPDLFTRATPGQSPVRPWRPKVCDAEHWPPDYKAVYAWRIEQLERIRSGELPLVGAKAYYKLHPAEFIMDWIDTYDPRRADLKWIPFVLFPKQLEVIELFVELVTDQESGLIEKSREVGVTWLAVAFAVWAWLFIDDFAIGFGSQLEKNVDELGMIDSIFEKIRQAIRRLPDIFLPEGFDPETHMVTRRIINPANGATIGGDIGKNIGRGGRKSIYFKDESAHYEQPELIEASLSATTNVQVDMSSVNGTGNPFYKRREAGVDWSPGTVIEKGKTRVLVVDILDHPEKTQAWLDQKREKWESEGMGHIFAQEYGRNYSASIANAIISGEWIKAAIDAHLKLPNLFSASGLWASGFDIADEGGDTNAQCMRQGVILRKIDEWTSRDPGVSARKAIANLLEYNNGNDVPLICEYDSVGMGTNVKSEWNRLTISIDEFKPPEIVVGARLMNPWNAGGHVQWPNARVIPFDDDSPFNKDFYGNLKAQGWYNLRTRFLKTWQAVTQGIQHNQDDLISLDKAALGEKFLRKLEKELAQPTSIKNNALKVIVEKKPDNAKSPNLADAVMMCYFPAISPFAAPVVGNYGNA